MYHICGVNTKLQASNELFSDALIRIFTLCSNLLELDLGGSGVNSFLSINHRPAETCFSSSLMFLRVKVASFDDCLCLLDGRLEKLSSFCVKVHSISETLSPVDNTVSFNSSKVKKETLRVLSLSI